MTGPLLHLHFTMSLAPRFILAAAVFLVAGCELQELVARTQQSLLDIADDATAWAEDNADLFGGVESLRNGPGDAARHQYWSCLLAVLYSEDLSRNLTTAWEEASIAHGGPLHESQMDLLNNAEGILLARSITSTGETGPNRLRAGRNRQHRGRKLRIAGRRRPRNLPRSGSRLAAPIQHI